MEDLFYDGETPLPKKGILNVKQNDLCFVTDRKEYRFSGQDIVGVEKFASEYRLEIRNLNSPNATVIIVFYSEITYDNLIDIVKQGKGDIVSGIWMSTGIWQKIGALTIAAFIVIFGYNSALSYLYHVVPLSYDKTRATLLSPKIREFLYVCSAPEINRMVDTIGKRLKDPADPFTYDIVVVQDNITNAFALPGGNIIIFTNLLSTMESPEELAGVIAHEMAHVRRRHGTRNEIRYLGNFLFLSLAIGSGFEGVEFIENMDTFYELTSAALFSQKFSREFEMEADLEALENLKKSNITVEGLLHWFERLKITLARKEKEESSMNIPDFLSSHPPTDERIDAIRREIAKRGNSSGKLGISRSRWIRIRNQCGPRVTASIK
ncbi:peptidase, M48 family [Leptospira inadai serovar Lyme str. 10]|uniref:Peptidase, M48 family n=2 Tax=Leptospira inadai serovar Lyme TaxID=293084 RepID=V6HGR7_9LEPT|nr:M48 family metallopeptidase [Leptospira inadai]EQA34770.1 peptidase, M48 family [Leptospira inadai serovar Lyme str. 10]PNV75903.1 peptidase [Leptospira inadai serovar Lyme]